MPDYPGASEHFVPQSFMFNSNARLALVLHKTGGDATLEAVYNTFMQSGKSVHYAIDQAGVVWQFVPESMGAGGNCCVEAGYDPFWQPYLNEYGNLNLCTISIEHCDAATDNSTPLTPAQQAASFRLVAYLVQKYNLSISHIKTHASIDPISRARCPGNYPMNDLFTYLANGGQSMNTVPQGWKDDGTTLSAPNNVPIVHGFRAYVLAHNWDPNNYPLGTEYGTQQLEESNPSLGGGTQQVFRTTMLGYTPGRGVFEEWLGVELVKQRKLTAQYQEQATALQVQLIASSKQPTPDLKLTLYADAIEQIAAIVAHVEQS